MAAAHAEEPFSTTDPRATIRRVGRVLAALEVEATVYRGGLDLRGAEVDHVWLAVEDVEADGEGSALGGARVVDVAFPLFDARFVGVLRRFVAGDASAEDLDAAGAEAGIEARVLGHFPPPMRYLGRPIWSAR